MSSGDETSITEDDKTILVNNEELDDDASISTSIVPIKTGPPKRDVVEPVLFLLFAALTLFESTVPNTIEIQFCTSVLNISSADCLNTTTANKENLQRFTSSFSIARSIIEVLAPCILSFFVGPWSDTFGRKPLMLSASVGYFLTYCLWTWGSSIPTLDPIYFLLFSIPLALSGGSTIMILSTFCYVCDVTTVENRGARLGRLQAALFVGAFLGTIICPILVDYGYTIAFGVASALCYLTLTYVHFFVDESIIPSQIELHSVSKNPFHLEHIKGLFEACYTKQTPKTRFTLFLLLLVLTCSLTNVFGESYVLYLFLQNVLNWDLYTFTNLSGFIILANAIGAYVGTWLFSKILKLDDLLILSVAAFSRILSSLIMLFGNQIWHIYFSRLLGSTLGLSGPLIRSFLSRVVPKDELGKVFSLLASIESTTPLLASLTYMSLYNFTLSTYPEAIFVLSGIILLFMLLTLTLLVYMYDPVEAVKKNKLRVTPSYPSINVS